MVGRQTDRGLSRGRGSREPRQAAWPDALACLQCPGGTFTPSMKSTKDYPDEVINFMRSHPLMYQPVYPLQRRPLVVRTGAPYRLTTVAVDQVDAADGRYEVLFLGTGTHCCPGPSCAGPAGWRVLLRGAGTYAVGVATGRSRSTLPPSSSGASPCCQDNSLRGGQTPFSSLGDRRPCMGRKGGTWQTPPGCVGPNTNMLSCAPTRRVPTTAPAASAGAASACSEGARQSSQTCPPIGEASALAQRR